MQRELKLKAKVDNFDSVRASLKQLKAKPLGRSTFVDTFFKPGHGEQVYEMRVRDVSGQRKISIKVLLNTNRVQVNGIYEFGCNKVNEFTDFLEAVGFTPCFLLRKKSELYKLGAITVELTSIEEDGKYVELITLEKDNSEKDLFFLLKKLGIPESSIDLRYYGKIKEAC